MNDSDQTTVKVHNFVTAYLDDMLKVLNDAGVEFKSDMALHDVAILRLKDQFDDAKKTEKALLEFTESIINDVFYLQDKKIVKVKMRSIPKRKKK